MPDQTGPVEGTGGRGGRRGDGRPAPIDGSGAPQGPGAAAAASAGSAGSGEGDFFDRLLARYAPSGERTGGGLARVRPRLPEPFERIESLGAADDTGSGTAAGPWSAAPDTAPSPYGTGRAPREVHTEHERTLLHTERTPERDDPAARGPAPRAAEPAALRPATTPLPRRSRPAEPATRRAGRGEGTAADAAGDAAAGRLVPEAGAVLPSGVGALRPASTADVQASRGAARAVTARRGGRGTEQVVHVQIGRLEVSAAGPPPRPGRQDRAPARRAPTVGLEDFLRQGRDGDRAR